jgi:hypothetical protein
MTRQNAQNPAKKLWCDMYISRVKKVESSGRVVESKRARFLLIL